MRASWYLRESWYPGDILVPENIPVPEDILVPEGIPVPEDIPEPEDIPAPQYILPGRGDGSERSRQVLCQGAQCIPGVMGPGLGAQPGRRVGRGPVLPPGSCPGCGWLAEPHFPVQERRPGRRAVSRWHLSLPPLAAALWQAAAGGGRHSRALRAAARLVPAPGEGKGREGERGAIGNRFAADIRAPQPSGSCWCKHLHGGPGK